MLRAALLLVLSAILAHAGVVETLDGQSYEGRIQLAGGALVVTSTNALAATVALTNLLRADFNAPTNLAKSPGAPRLRPPILDEARGALPPPWQSRDIGQVEERGSATHYEGTFTVASGHRSNRGDGDGFHFIHQPWKGDGEIIARVASIEPRDQKERQPRAGVLLRAGLEAESLSVLMSVSGGLGTYFRKWGKGADRPVMDSRPDLKPPYWIKLVREGRRFSGYQSTDGATWQLLCETEADMPDRIHAGLALINARKGEVARATFDHLRLGGMTPVNRFVPRVVLRDGTVIADPFTKVDDATVTFSKDKKGLLARTATVASLLFAPTNDAPTAPPGRTGVLLRNGDFIDGEFRGLSDGRVRISSVLFGVRSYELKNKVAAVILGDLKPQPAAYEVRTLDGSVLPARSLTLESDAVRADIPLTGAWRIPAAELVFVTRRR